MARPIERQPAHRIDIIFQFTHAFAGVRIDPGEILRIITGQRPSVPAESLEARN